MKLISIFILLVAFSCKQKETISQAKILTDSANNVFKTSLDPRKSLPLLEQAIKLDSNYYPALVTKFNFELASGLLENALVTGKSLIRVKPEVAEYYTGVGFIYDKNNDTISSKRYFLDAVACYDKKLAKMPKTHKDYNWTLLGKGTNLILAGKVQSGYDILTELYATSHDEGFKEHVKTFMNKSKQQILEEMK